MADTMPNESIAATIPEPYRLDAVLSRRSSTVTSAVTDSRSGEALIYKRLELGALKSLDELERFEREAELLGQLSHPGLPTLIECRREQGPEGLSLVLVSTRLPGSSLAERLAAGWRPDQAQLRAIARQALELLQVVHAAGVLHRDLKPGNLLLDDQGRLALVDFGAARHQLRGSATVAGTFGYLAPEQFYGRSLPESDLYGLGATLIHLLTGRHPAELPRDGLRLRWREFASGDEALLDWVERLVDPDPDHRPASAAQALAMLDGQPGNALLPRDESSPWERIQHQRLGPAKILTVRGPGLKASLKSLAVYNLPMLALFGICLLLSGLAEVFMLLTVVVGIVTFFWCLAATILILGEGLRRNQIWLGPEALHLFLKAANPADYASKPLPPDLKFPYGRRYVPGVYRLDQVKGVQILGGFLSGSPKESDLKRRVAGGLGRFANYRLELQLEHQRETWSLPVFQGLTLSQALWLQRELLGWLLRHQSEAVARQALLQLQHNQRLQQAFDETGQGEGTARGLAWGEGRRD